MPLNLLIFSRYTNSQASTRVRFSQFIPYLNKQGITVELFSLLSERSINKKHQFYKLFFSHLTVIRVFQVTKVLIFLYDTYLQYSFKSKNE